jgi:hypothetical protein
MKKALLLVAALAAFVSVAIAAPQVQKTATFAYLYDVDSATLTYCVMTGQNGDPYGQARVVNARIKTTGGPTTTVTEFTGSSNPFTDLAVGDTILVTDSAGVRQQLEIVARASAASITVSSSVTLELAAGHPFTWLKQTCGTAASDGWIYVGNASQVAMTVQYEQGDLGGLRVRWECKPNAIGAAPVIVYPGESSDCGIGGTLSTDRCNFATAGETARLTVVVDPNPFAYCRVGLAYVTSDTSDAAANLEKVTASLVAVQ